MAKALTVRTIDTLATPAARREVPDGLVNGLYLVLPAIRCSIVGRALPSR